MDHPSVHRYFESGRCYASTCGPTLGLVIIPSVFTIMGGESRFVTGGPFLGYFKVHIGRVFCYLEA
jgi:hypothetical protein